MDNKDTLMKFIDAIISGDEDAQAFEFKKYAEGKTIDLMGATSKNVSECLSAEQRVLFETLIDDDIELTAGDKVLLNGKQIGKLSYSGEDIVGKGSQLIFVEPNGITTSVKDNSIEELVKLIRKKFPSNTK